MTAAPMPIGLVDSFRFTLHLRPVCSINDIPDDRAGMSVRRRRFTRPVVDLYNGGLEASTVQMRQDV